MAILQVNVTRDSDKPEDRNSQGRNSQQNRIEQHTDQHNSERNGAQNTRFRNGGGKEAGPFENLTRHHGPMHGDGWQAVVWRLSPGTPVGRALISATQRLEEAGSPSAHLDAQVILAHVLGQDRSWLFAHYDYALDEEQAARFIELVARRVAHEPVAYLVGRKEFYGLELAVDGRVLIPRPETELLVDAVLDHIDSRGDKRVVMADVGTGSGAIALAVAANAPEATLYALDISDHALTVARRNVDAHGKQEQVTTLKSDLLAALTVPVDIIAANLPYINSATMDELEAGVREYEPHLALAGGPDGLDVIRELLLQIPTRLKPGGVIFLEIGSDQGPAALELVYTLLPIATYVGLRQDYHGLDRLVVIGT